MAIRPQWLLNLGVLVVPLLWQFPRRLWSVAGLVGGLAVVLSGVVLHNSAAAGKLTGFSENGGINFWMGQCNVRSVTTVDPVRPDERFHFVLVVPLQLGRGSDHHFVGPMAWDEGYFYSLGMRCVREQGLAHARLLGRNLLDMTATSTPWPQATNERGERGIILVSNSLYSLLLPWIVIETLFTLWRRRGSAAGEATLLVHLACAVVVALLYFGEPRIRSVYDVFGLALLAALVSYRLGLDSDQSGAAAGRAPVQGESSPRRADATGKGLVGWARRQAHAAPLHPPGTVEP